MGARELLSHHAELISASSISDEVAIARGYRSVSTKAELKKLGFAETQCRVPALLIPVRSVTGEIATYQIRPDEPRIKNGKPLKYETPARAHMALDVPVAARERLCDPSIPLFITEGARKADSAVSHGLCCVALLGVWNFRGKNEKGGLTALADWESIALNSRKVYIAFDSDVMEKDSVKLAMRRLSSFLESRRAEVRLIYLPAGEGGAKVGLDDYFAAGGNIDGLMRLATSDLQEDDTQEIKPERKSQATILIELASEAELFHTSARESYATVKVAGHNETWLLKSSGFSDWLMRRFYKTQGKSPSSQAYKDALGVLYGKAIFDGESHEVYTRVAMHDGALYVDLADESWRIVRITAEGWSLIGSENAPVRFRRTRGMLPLPEPSRGGTLGELRRFVNVRDDADWTLLLAWLVASVRPNLPMPLLALYGVQGSAKSTTARVIASILDPTKAALRSEPRDERDLMITARNRWCLTFDNLSHISNSFSDALCRLATGGGLSTRELYSDDEEVLFEALRPIVINGIDDLATRGDLLSRAVVLYLPPFSGKARRKEGDLWREFEQARPSICGALYDAVCVALRRVDSTQIDNLPRMADFTVWAAAAESAFGVAAGTFIEAYRVNRATANKTALDDTPLSEALMKLLDAESKSFWTGTASGLLEALQQHVSEQVLREKTWPKAANTLTNKLRRLAPSLRTVGLEFRESRTGRERTRILTIERVENLSSASSAPSAGAYALEDSADGELSADDGSDSLSFDRAEPSSALKRQQFQVDKDSADDADGLLPNGSKVTSCEPLNEDEAELAARLEYMENLPRAEAERRAREWYALTPV